MDVKDVLINMCNEMIETNRHCRDLGRICRGSFARQNKINTRLHVGIVVGLMSIAIVESRRKAMQNEINILKNELKELKTAKEE